MKNKITQKKYENYEKKSQKKITKKIYYGYDYGQVNSRNYLLS